MYFRMLLVGYMEGIGSERGIAWRCADSISLREIKGERYVVLPFGILADPGWEARDRPAVKLSRE